MILQRSEYELPVCDSDNWTERHHSAETFRKPTDEKCSSCKKPAKTQVRMNSCFLLRLKHPGQS